MRKETLTMAVSNSNVHRAESTTLLDSAIEDELAFLGEQYFHHLLMVERKRTERSGNPSLLMLIDVGSLSGDPNRSKTIYRINMLLSSVLRETDIKGWYKSYSVIGVILSEIGDSNPIEAREMIRAKFQKGISDGLDRDQAEGIGISFESITKGKNWKNGNSLLKLRTYDSETSPGQTKNFAFLIKSLVGGWLFLFMVDLLLISAAQFAGFCVRFGDPVNIFNTHAGAYYFSVITYIIFLYIFDLYNRERVFHTREVTLRITLSVILALGTSAAGFYLVPQLEYGRGVLAIQAVAVWVLLTGWRVLYRNIFQFTKSKIPTLIIGAGEMGKSALQLLSSPHSQFEVAGFLDDDPAKIGYNGNGTPPVLGTTDKLFDIISKMGIKTVVLANEGNGSGRITRNILEARLCGREVLDLPSLYEKIANRIPVKHVEDRWFVYADGFHLISREYVQKIKRIFDFVFSGILLILSLPLVVLTALAIRVDSRGPVFYKQTRIGKGGNPFTVFKFRSMCHNAEETGAKWAQRRDPRVTRVGKWIRIFRIDELPQIWNVFIGDMSLIGPRPERPEFVEELNRQVPYYSVRHTVRPGITGWAQIKYPYGASVEDAVRKLEYDLYYIKNMSLMQDLKILLQTVGVVIMGEGAR
jgi:sugar transferase (PEP-CTERM system associated)